MKVNRKDTIRIFVLLLFTIAAITAFTFICVNRDDGALLFELGFDPLKTYIPQFSSLIPIDDWHSSLFMYEGRMISHIIGLFIGNTAESGRWSYMLMYISAHAIILSCTVYLIYILSTYRFCYIAICIPLSYSLVHLYVETEGHIDLFFCSVCFLLIIFLIYAKYININKFAFYLVLLSISIHLIELRKNSILPIFVIILTILLSFNCKYLRYFYLNILPCRKGSRDEASLDGHRANNTTREMKPRGKLRFILKSSLYSGIIALALYYVATHVTGWIFPVEHRFPLTPMIESDLRISALLRGEGEALRSKLAEVGYTDSEHIFKNRMTAFWAGDWSNGREINTSKIINLYITNWKNYPRETATAKIIQAVQFINGGITPHLIQSHIEKLYPELNVTPETWMPPRAGATTLRRLFNCGLFCLMLILPFGLILAHKKRNKYSMLYTSSWIVIVFCLFYIIGFFIVTPTADGRYLAPIYLLGLPAIIINITELILLHSSKKAEVQLE